MRALAAAVVFAACTTPPPEPAITSPAGPVARSLADAAHEAGVPLDLVTAIAIEEGGVKLPATRAIVDDDPVPVAGALELRHGRLDTLALGARLMTTTELALRTDTALATRAGALVVASLGASTGASPDDLATWRPALEQLSGMDEVSARDYATRVLAIAHTGGRFAARDGEWLIVAPHRELVDPVAVAIAPATPTPDYPGAIWFTTSCTNKCNVGRTQGNAAVDTIVIHDTEGGWDGSVATLQNDPNKSVHYIVDADGSRVGQFRPETDTTWHSGNSTYNARSVGIEHVGVASDPAGYSTGLYATSRALVENIRTRWSVPLDRAHIIGHYQVPNGNTIAAASPPCSDTLGTCETSSDYGGANNHRDPGYHWQWCEYMKALGGTCTCNDTYDHWNCTTDHTEAVRCTNGVVEIDDCTEGCDVMPVGTDDVCHVAPVAMPDAGVDEMPAASPSAAGCCAIDPRGAPGSIGLALAVFALLAPRRRSRRDRQPAIAN